MPGQKLRQMTADGRIGRIRQAAAQRALALARRIAELHLRQKPSTTDCCTCARVKMADCVLASSLLPPPSKVMLS